MTSDSNGPAIRVNGLGKRYRKTLGGTYVPYQTLRETIMNVATAPVRKLRRGSDDGIGRPQLFWALRHISFEVEQGEAVGIIGRNGAGKTTLLKLLARVTEPTEGSAEIYGRIGSLLEVGTGFHQELTGRENVYLNGSILGMSRREIKSRFDEIVAFAEIEEFIDTQVKHYSSGMYMRLAFSVAAHLEPEILLIDEVLAVGDVAFQAKCLGKMSEVTRGGRTILFVSHNMGAINALCDKAIWIEKGRIMQIGSTVEVTEACTRFQMEAAGGEERVGYKIDVSQLEDQQGGFALTDCSLKNPKNPRMGSRTGDPFEITIDYRAKTDFISPAFVVKIKDMFGQELIRLSSMPISGYKIDSLYPHGRVQLRIGSLPLVASHYVLDVQFVRSGMEIIAAYETLVEFNVEPFDYYGSGMQLDRAIGLVVVDHSWSHGPLLARSVGETGEPSNIHEQVMPSRLDVGDHW
jgi:homopolymeric O-antigen transport system ATP-binding protein